MPTASRRTSSRVAPGTPWWTPPASSAAAKEGSVSPPVSAGRKTREETATRFSVAHSRTAARFRRVRPAIRSAGRARSSIQR